MYTPTGQQLGDRGQEPCWPWGGAGAWLRSAAA